MTPTHDFYDDWQDIQAELEAQTDREAAIVGAALLEAKLVYVIKNV